MSLTQIIMYSLALGILFFTVVFVISYVSSRLNRAPVPYSEHDSLVHHTREMRKSYNRQLRTAPGKVLFLNNHEEIKNHSLDYGEETKIIHLERYKRNTLDAQQRKMSGRRFTVVNAAVNTEPERMNYVPTYTRGISSADANFY